MNKGVNKYFDWKFENSVLDTRPYGDEPSEWEGIWIGDEMVIGVPLNDDNGTWFTNGPYFNGGNDYFGMSYPDFNIVMMVYLNSKYPDLRIKRIY
jgi:hypothetical protein